MSPRAWSLAAFTFFCVGALPWFASQTGSEAEVWALYQRLCHQQPERTLTIHTHPMVVCSRCAGINLGLMLGALGARLFRSWRRLGSALDWQVWGRRLVLTSIALNLVEGGLSALGWLPLSHALRILCGASFGGIATLFLLARLQPQLGTAATSGHSAPHTWQAKRPLPR